MYLSQEEVSKLLVGKTILKIFMNEDNLKFETDQGNVVFFVYGDCCSESVFYDFYGVENLIGKKVKEVKEVELKTDERMDAKRYQEDVKVYGYTITTENPTWGDVTSVFSFRNYSNGYYGGSLELEEDINKVVLPEITKDVVMTQ